MVPYDTEPLDPVFEKTMTWESGQRILRVTQIIKRHKQLFPVYITSFICGPDSFLLGYFRRIMGDKPSLTLELDNHTADAGINSVVCINYSHCRFLKVLLNVR
jgi:predicted nucleotide-binding protein (sugar kinase/HSP70/actin superfamily)